MVAKLSSSMSLFGLLVVSGAFSVAHAQSTDAPAQQPMKVSRAEYREITQMQAVLEHLQATLVDPQSAQFTLPFGFTPSVATWKIWGVDTTGYFTCGVVNSRNKMGGYAGNVVFIGVIKHDGSVETTLDSADRPLLQGLCEEKRQAGQLPALSLNARKALLN